MGRGARVGVVGAGSIGAVHARSALLAGARLTGVAASSPRRSQEAAAQLGAEQAFAGAEALVESPDADVVFVAAPNALHEPLAAAALAAGEHVVCEKPLALDGDGAQRLTDQAAVTDRLAAVPFVSCDLAEFVTGHRVVRLSARTTTAVPERARSTSRQAFVAGEADGDVRRVTTEDAAVLQFETDAACARRASPTPCCCPPARAAGSTSRPPPRRGRRPPDGHADPPGTDRERGTRDAPACVRGTDFPPAHAAFGVALVTPADAG